MTRKPQDIAGKIFETADANRTVHEGRCGFANPGSTVRVTFNGNTITARARTPLLPGTAVIVQLADGSYEALQEGAPSEIGQQIIEQERRNEVPTLESPAIAYVLLKRTLEEKLDCTCPTWSYDGATRECYPVCDGGSYETLEQCLLDNSDEGTHPGPFPPPDGGGWKFCAPTPITMRNTYFYEDKPEDVCVKTAISRCWYIYTKPYNVFGFSGYSWTTYDATVLDTRPPEYFDVFPERTACFTQYHRFFYSQLPIPGDICNIPRCSIRGFVVSNTVFKTCDFTFPFGAFAIFPSLARSTTVSERDLSPGRPGYGTTYTCNGFQTEDIIGEPFFEVSSGHFWRMTSTLEVSTPSGWQPLGDWLDDNLSPAPTEGESREPNRIQYLLGGDRAEPILVQEFNASDPHDVTASILASGNPLIVFRHGGEDEEHYCKVTAVEVAGNQTVKTTYEYNTNLKDLPDIWQKPFIRTFDRTPAPAQNPCLQNYQGNNFAYLGSSNVLTLSLSTQVEEGTDLQTWLQTTPQGEGAIQVNGKLASYAVKDNACTLGAEEDQAIELYPIGMEEGDEIVAIIPYNPGI